MKEGNTERRVKLRADESCSIWNEEIELLSTSSPATMGVSELWRSHKALVKRTPVYRIHA